MVEHFHGAALVSAALGPLKGYSGAAGAAGGGGGGAHPGAAGLAAAKRACLARRVHQELTPVLQVSCCFTSHLRGLAAVGLMSACMLQRCSSGMYT
jgi:hypothetical protein